MPLQPILVATLSQQESPGTRPLGLPKLTMFQCKPAVLSFFSPHPKAVLQIDLRLC